MQEDLACITPMGPDGYGGAEFLCLRSGKPLAISVGALLWPTGCCGSLTVAVGC